jgi:hypothetical protein
MSRHTDDHTGRLKGRKTGAIVTPGFQLPFP